MKPYYSVCLFGEDCGHKHKIRASAFKCLDKLTYNGDQVAEILIDHEVVQ